MAWLSNQLLIYISFDLVAAHDSVDLPGSIEALVWSMLTGVGVPLKKFTLAS